MTLKNEWPNSRTGKHKPWSKAQLSETKLFEELGWYMPFRVFDLIRYRVYFKYEHLKISYGIEMCWESNKKQWLSTL